MRHGLLVAFVPVIAVGALGSAFVGLERVDDARDPPAELVDPLLDTAWPQSQLLVQQVNTNTTVFPSLHTSLSVTAALAARGGDDPVAGAVRRWRKHRTDAASK